MSLNKVLILNEKADSVDTPPAGKIHLYLNSGSLKYKDSTGAVFTLAVSGADQNTYLEDFLDETPFSTASTSNQVAATFTTLLKPAGRYRVGLSWTWSASDDTNDSIFSLFIDGVQASPEFRMEVKEKTNQVIPSGLWVDYINFTSPSTHTIEFRTRSENAANTVTVQMVMVEIWRTGDA
jgi:hypothetical protein